jgi:crotonobetainyl-CoA:carnitine CoA-transferase CaiB-like acyl-CoA transferase
VVVEAMRPGSLARRGLGFDDLQQINPEDRVLQHLGLRHDRPVPDAARARHRVRHWAGVVGVGVDDEGFSYIPEHASIGIHAGR